jgi:hypothetical protein
MAEPLTINNDPCDCPKGQCAHFCEPDDQCINRLPNATVTTCEVCLSMTWHSDGKCLRCAALVGSPREGS